MSVDLPLELPPVKPWDQRSKGVLPLAGGNEQYLNTLAWILECCRDHDLDAEALRQRYATAYELNLDVAYAHLTALRRYGLLEDSNSRRVATATSRRWLETRQPDLVIGTMQANVRFIGEMLELTEKPRSKKALLQLANGRYGFTLRTSAQVDFRLGWLRSAGFVRMLDGAEYEATDAGLAFLERIELYRPTTASTPAPDEPPPESDGGIAQDATQEEGELNSTDCRGEDGSAPDTKWHRSARELAAEIGDRLEALSCDGAKHQEFEVAVRDAFAFLGFSAERLSGSGQTDVLLAAIRPPAARKPDDSASWSYKVAVDAKAATNGALGDGQVSFPALTLHREKHAAAFSVLVGPNPRPRLLQFAAKASVAVLSAGQLAGLCRDHADVPLPVADYFWLFADSEGDPRGGAVELSPVADARAQASAGRNLLAQVGEAVHDIAADFGPASRQLVRFSLAKTAALSGDALGIEVAAALDFLSSSWLQAIARADPGSTDPHYVPMAPGRTVAARLRWLADAFDEALDQAGETSKTG